jgi:hypothetical protein
MIFLHLQENEKTFFLSGDAVEMAIFYCQWQTVLWPDWMAHTTIDEQHKKVIDTIKSGESVWLANINDTFKTAALTAVQRCENLGIDVRWRQKQVT